MVDPDEPEVQADEPMPKGYKFVPKGDVYVTKHCRKKTHEAEKTLYVVLDKNNKPIGLRCPTYIYNAVMGQNKATASRRAEAVQKRDAAIEENFEDAILKLFPTIPKAEIPQILKQSLKKHSRRVGRTNTVALQDRVKLAVRAHIRHMHTDYDQLLKQGVSRLEARAAVWDKLNEVARQWGGRPLKPLDLTAAKAKAEKKLEEKGTPSTKAGSAKKAVLRTATHSHVFTRRMRSEMTEALHRVRRTTRQARQGPQGIRKPAGTASRMRTRRMASGADFPGDGNHLAMDQTALGEGVNEAAFARDDEDTDEGSSDCSEWSGWSNDASSGETEHNVL